MQCQKVHLFELTGGGLAYEEAELTHIEIENSELARRSVAGLNAVQVLCRTCPVCQAQKNTPLFTGHQRTRDCSSHLDI